MMRRVAAVVALALLAGCSLIPEPAKHAFRLPEPTAQAEDFGDLERWWLRFDDAELTTHIERALAANAGLAVAAARIEEAGQQVRIANQKLYPDVSLDAAATRARRSERTTNTFPGLPVITDNRQMGLAATYELDLWGKVRSGEQSALERLQAQGWARHTLQTTVAAQTARTLFLIRTLEQQVTLTRSTIELADEALKILARQRDAGLLGDFEYLQNRAERDAFAVRLVDLADALARAKRALAVLEGAEPDEIAAAADAAFAADLPTLPEVPEGLASGLLLQRPDVRQAEAELRASNADIGAARAAYFPQLTLTGRYGYQGKEFSDLLTAPARVWSLGLALLQPLVGLRLTDAQVKAARARLKVAEASYVQTVQNAFVDTGNALGARTTAREARLLQQSRETDLTSTLGMAERRFDAGLTGALDVIDARRNLLAAQLDALDRRNAELGATVDLFRALGGGWSEAPTP